MFRRNKTREDKFNAYLIGEGILSNPPKVDPNFFQLAGLCAGSSWRVSAGHGMMPRDNVSPNNDDAVAREGVVIGTDTETNNENVTPMSQDTPQYLFRLIFYFSDFYFLL